MLALRRKKYIAFTLVGLLLFANISSLAFADDAAVASNGSLSSNNITITNNNSTNVNQQNTTDVSNSVTSTSNTGSNITNNTGGNTNASTGNASASTVVSTTGGSNSADITSPSNAKGNTSVTVSGNGSGSNNSVHVDSGSQVSISQDNTTDINTRVQNSQNTGRNSMLGNTGGDTQLSTGNAESNTSVVTQANGNSLAGSIGGSEEESVPLQVEIAGNGSNSVNTVRVNFPKQIHILSNNELNLSQTINCKQNTGKNITSGNTGGSAMLVTGNTNCNGHIQNIANINSIQLPSQQVCQNIPPVTPPSEVPSTPSTSTSTSTSQSSTPSTSNSSPSSSSSNATTPAQQVLGVSTSTLPATGSNLWENVLFYLALGAAGLLSNYLSKRKSILFTVTLH